MKFHKPEGKAKSRGVQERQHHSALSDSTKESSKIKCSRLKRTSLSALRIKGGEGQSTMAEPGRLTVSVGMLAVWCSVVAGTLPVSKLQLHRKRAKDGIVPSPEPLFQEVRVSELSCARQCSDHPACHAITFVGDREGSCYGFCPVDSASDDTAVDTEAKTFTTEPSCRALVASGRLHGVVHLCADLSTYLGQAYCDGLWLVFQRRQNGRVDFYRGWEDYRNGFGDPEDEYWLGLETIRQLTSQGRWNLRVDLRDRDGNSAYAIYSNFRLGSEDSFYPLLYDSFTGGTAGDSLAYHRGLPFSTKDRDNDEKNGSCAVNHHGAWWYNDCHYSNLNGHYNNDSNAMGTSWVSWKDNYRSLPFTEMKIQKV